MLVLPPTKNYTPTEIIADLTADKQMLMQELSTVTAEFQSNREAYNAWPTVKREMEMKLLKYDQNMAEFASTKHAYEETKKLVRWCLIYMMCHITPWRKSQISIKILL